MFKPLTGEAVTYPSVLKKGRHQASTCSAILFFCGPHSSSIPLILILYAFDFEAIFQASLDLRTLFPPAMSPTSADSMGGILSPPAAPQGSSQASRSLPGGMEANHSFSSLKRGSTSPSHISSLRAWAASLPWASTGYGTGLTKGNLDIGPILKIGELGKIELSGIPTLPVNSSRLSSPSMLMPMVSSSSPPPTMTGDLNCLTITNNKSRLTKEEIERMVEHIMAESGLLFVMSNPERMKQEQVVLGRAKNAGLSPYDLGSICMSNSGFWPNYFVQHQASVADVENIKHEVYEVVGSIPK
ncbi:hypothetical protein B0H19DRAFT_1055770 [Mycena capillaripes]|nr:hypothetical protein B0H19DRAFT_1055770 [Mycena capillaripes]